MAGAFGSPYRAPCGGWPSRLKLWLAGCLQRTPKQTAAVWENVTKVPDYADPPGAPIAPYGRPQNESCKPVTCGAGYPACGPWGDYVAECTAGPGETVDQVGGNCYRRTTGQVTSGGCDRPLGWKGVQASKHWHGRRGFHDPDQCDPKTTCPSTKYLTIERRAERFANCWDLTVTPNVEHTTRSTALRKYTVDRHTGRISQVECQDPGDDGSICYDPVEIEDITEYAGIDYSCDGFTASDPTVQGWLDGLPEADGEILVEGIPTGYAVSRSHSDTQLCIVYDYDSRRLDPDDPLPIIERLSITITLSDPYTSQDLVDDCKGLLEAWPLADDLRLPWRTDSNMTVAPWVRRAEVPSGVSPDVWHDCGWVDTTAVQHGGGEPLPAGYGGHFDWHHPTYEFQDPGWCLTHLGAKSGDPTLDETDALVPESATLWTDNYTASLFPGGAFALFEVGTQRLTLQKIAVAKLWGRPSHNFFRPCGEDRYERDESLVRCLSAATEIEFTVTGTDPAYEGGDLVLINHASVRGVYEVYPLGSGTYELTSAIAPLPSWYPAADGTVGPLRWWTTARPICGRIAIIAATDTTPIEITLAGDCELLTGDQITISGNAALNGDWTVTFLESRRYSLDTSTAAGAYTGGAYAKSQGAPDYQWHDDQPKGDFAVRSWLYDYRGAALESAPEYAETITESCLKFTPCSPGVIVISPNTETFRNQSAQSFVTSVVDPAYGGLWMADARQIMDDPLWQAPAAPCDIGGDVWQEDDGSCAAVAGAQLYAHAPQVEYRATVPSGGPALPAGSSLPGAEGPGLAAHWALQVKQEGCVCDDGEFGDIYAAEGVPCLEVLPP